MSNDIVIQLTPPEAAEQVAWMLRGQVLGQGRVAVPPQNANKETLTAVASIQDATWQQVEDDQTEFEDAEEVDAYLTLLHERIATLMSPQDQLGTRPEISHHPLVLEQMDQRSEAQKRFDRAFADDRKYLQREDFAGIDASRLTLRDIHFDQCDLRNANFENARLSNCTFFEANLSGANFKNAQLPGTVFSSAVLTETNFDSANLCSAQLDWSNLRQSLLCNANLQNASLQSANLEKADCSGTDFTDVNLSGAKLKQAICIAAQFIRSNLTHADLAYAKLTAAQFAQANLSFANLDYSKGFDRHKHRGVFYERTQLADSFRPISTQKPIIEALRKWGGSTDALCVLAVLACIGVTWMILTSPTPSADFTLDSSLKKVLKQHIAPAEQ